MTVTNIPPDDSDSYLTQTWLIVHVEYLERYVTH